jgi:Ca2+-binding EF-hand superfamily protein
MRGLVSKTAGSGSRNGIDTDRIILLRDAAGLSQISPFQLAAAAKRLLQNKASITEDEFADMILGIGGQKKGWERSRHERALKDIFTLVDFNKNGTIEADEMLNALTLLSGGSEDEKIEAVFSLYDLDDNGLITLDELVRHQTAVFRVAFSTNPGLKQKIGESPSNLAQVTAE